MHARDRPDRDRRNSRDVREHAAAVLARGVADVAAITAPAGLLLVIPLLVRLAAIVARRGAEGGQERLPAAERRLFAERHHLEQLAQSHLARAAAISRGLLFLAKEWVQRRRVVLGTTE